MHFAHGLCDLEFDDTTNEGATFRTTFLLIELNLPPLKACGQKPLASNLGHPPYGYNSHRSRLGRDNGPKLFRKTNIANDVAGALHPIVGRSGPDTVNLFTFLTLERLPRVSPNDMPSDSVCRPPNPDRPLRHASRCISRLGQSRSDSVRRASRTSIRGPEFR